VSLLGMNSNFAFARQPQIINVEGRKCMTLNGYWKYLVHPYQTGYYDYRLNVRDQQAYQNTSEAVYLGYKAQDPSERVEYDFNKADDLIVPRDWNSQKEKLFYYEGAVWYYKRFDCQPPENGNRLFIHFGAANYRAHVYLNGEKLGTHTGGFTPFNFEITGKVRPDGNVVIVMVDNTRGRDEVPTVNTDWWNYGGLTRDVRIIEVPDTFIRDYFIQLSPDDKESVDVSLTLDGKNKAGQTVRTEIPEAKINAVCTTDDQGIAVARVKARGLKYWNPVKPYLYEVNIIHLGSVLTDRIGFRTLKTEGTEILLNGKPVIVSEFGADALQELHGSREARWTEEFQEHLYAETVSMLEKIPQLRGVTPCILTDFRSPRRLLPGIQDGWNRKGLVSQTGDKKKAFYVLRDYYKMKERQFDR